MNRLLAVLLTLCLVGLPVGATAAPAVEVEPPSRWIGLVADLIQRVFASGTDPEEDEEPPTTPPVPIAPQPTAEPQELNPDGGTEQRPDWDPIG